MTPIEVWPTVKHSGKPGYSSRHFTALAGAQDDPLRIADRIKSRAIAEQLNAELQQKLAAGVPLAELMTWQSDELARRKETAWRMLCQSFSLVCKVLAEGPQTPAIRRALAEARKHARQVGCG